MDAQAIETLGGICQILGVLIVVRDLLAIHEYLGDLGRLMVRMRTWRVRFEAALRRLLRRPGRGTVAYASSATASVGVAGSVTARVTPGSFTPDPTLSPAEQLAAQAEYLNRLRDWIMREVEQRDRAIEEERALARAALQAEAGRLERLIGAVSGEVDRLRELTTSGTGSRWFGVPLLLAGVVFTTWDEELAGVWPAWLSPAVLGFLAACGLAALFCWLILDQLRRDRATS
jgi:hypothetical protein